MRSSAGEFLKVQAVSPSVLFHLEIPHHSVFFFLPVSVQKCLQLEAQSCLGSPVLYQLIEVSNNCVSVVCHSEEPDFFVADNLFSASSPIES